jgi:hypothetical protein
LFAMRSARRTRRPAIDARRTNSKEDASIESRVSVKHRLPKRFVIRKLSGVVILSRQRCCSVHPGYLHEHTKRA